MKMSMYFNDDVIGRATANRVWNGLIKDDDFSTNVSNYKFELWELVEAAMQLNFEDKQPKYDKILWQNKKQI